MKKKILKTFITILSIFLISNNIYAATASGSKKTYKIYETYLGTIKCLDNETLSSDKIKILYEKFGKISEYDKLNIVRGTTYVNGVKTPIRSHTKDIGKIYSLTEKNKRVDHTISHFTIESGNDIETAYCIQRGMKIPSYCYDINRKYRNDVESFNNKYNVVDNIDVRNCKSIKDTSVKYGACGVSEIFYQIKDKNSDFYKEVGSDNYNILSDDYNGYDIITTAIRLWINYWSKTYNINVSNIDDANGAYYKTAYAIVNKGYTGNTCAKESTALCYTSESDSDASRLKLAFKLFKYIYDHRDDEVQNGRFGEKAADFDLKVYESTKEKIEDAKNNPPTYNMTVKVKINEEVRKQIFTSCNPDNESCDSIVGVYDAAGKLVGQCKGDDIHNGTSCYRIEYNDDYVVGGKNSYTLSFQVYNFKLCDYYTRKGYVTTELKKPSVSFKLKGGITGSASLRIYYPVNYSTSSSVNTQIMLTYIDNTKKFDGLDYNVEGDEKKYTYIIPAADIDCDDSTCNSDSQCTNLDQVTDIKDTNDSTGEVNDVCDGSITSSKGFDFKTIEDPSMACILNNCNDSSKFEQSYSNNKQICTTYCREEVRFYIPTPANVYAGMQFTYDLGKHLKEYGVIKSQVNEEKKLTAVVVRYKHCTAVLDASEYNSMLDNYYKLIKERDELPGVISSLKASYRTCSGYKTESEKSSCESYNSSLSSQIKTKEERLTYLKNLNLEQLIEKLYNDKKDCMFETDNIKDQMTNINESIKLEVTYDEDKDLELKIDSESKIVETTEKYCAGDNCYKYNTTTTEESCETNESEFSSSRSKLPDTDSKYYLVKNGSRYNKKVYSNTVTKIQTDYYLSTKFTYEPYTGKTSINNSGKELPLYSYPISSTTDSGKYNIVFNFRDVNNGKVYGYKLFKFDCYYNVYNIIKKNNCDTTKDANCENICFEIDSEGNTIIDENCIMWASNGSVSLGFDYRNVSLLDMFPVARGTVNNWYPSLAVTTKNPYYLKNGLPVAGEEENISVGDLITKTETTGNDIYNDDHLEGRYELTTDTINSIRDYNKNNDYLNNTTYGCSKVTLPNGTSYYECKSTFMRDYFDSKGGN